MNCLKKALKQRYLYSLDDTVTELECINYLAWLEYNKYKITLLRQYPMREKLIAILKMGALPDVMPQHCRIIDKHRLVKSFLWADEVYKSEAEKLDGCYQALCLTDKDPDFDGRNHLDL